MTTTPKNLLVLDRAALAQASWSPAEVIGVIESAYKALGEGRSDNPGKLMSKAADGHSVAYAMLGRDGGNGTVGFKTSYKYDPAHDRANQHYYTTLTLYDDQTGLPLALMDCSLVGALRTPAVSALLARATAPHARTALIVGTGTQGRYALPFLLAALPKLERLIVHGHHPDGIAAVREMLQTHCPGRSIELSRDVHAAAREADLILGVAGPGCKDSVQIGDTAPGSTTILVGYGLDAGLLHKADYRIATNEEQMRTTGVDLVDANGQLPPVDAELPDILLGRKPARRNPEERVFAYNSGMVITDLALGRLLAERARAQGLGREVTLW
ncbi:ornithine cyclodeaminase [Andreprevotia chitinilytica]|uniref:ornithine cyclodeaminase n=1 Tax=Andreprevotia chitinilytica TaxID=396808 RepID=UPI0005586749|nr:ornithine cyclodeaminase [Andreprevotia chitinilytica]